MSASRLAKLSFLWLLKLIAVLSYEGESPRSGLVPNSAEWIGCRLHTVESIQCQIDNDSINVVACVQSLCWVGQ